VVVLSKLCCEVLLTSDLLRQFELEERIDYRTSEITLGAEVGKCKVICREARLVPPYSAVRVPVRREGHLCAWSNLVESSLSWWFATGVSTGRQRVTAVDGDVEDLWVTNFSCTPQWLPTGTVVCTVEPLCFITEMPRESME
jgi:hypothetical protein